MGRRPRKPKAMPKNAVEKLRADLRGGVGQAPAGQSPFAGLEAAESAAIEPTLSRLEVQRPTLKEGVRKRMSVKQADSRQQVAEATLQAAIQHRNAPDAGSSLYMEAFQSLAPDVQNRLLSSLSESEAAVVRQAFSPAPDAAPQPQRRSTAEDRAKDAARRALAEAGLEPMPTFNPETGENVVHYVNRGPQPGVQTVDRLTPSDFSQLSPDAQRAASLGAEIQEAVEQMERWNPDFLDTAQGRRLADEMFDILEAHPEIESYIDNPSLEGRQMPPYGDAVEQESGRAALPASMRLSTYIGGEPAASFKLAEQAERRTGRYKDIPADAPNRMAWVLLKDAEEATQKGITIQELRRRRDPARAQANIEGPKPQRRASAVEVFLPTPDDIAEKEIKRGARADVEYSGPGLQARRMLDEPLPEGATTDTPVAREDRARQRALDAAYAEAARAAKEAQGLPAKPVEDISQTEAAWEPPVQRVPLPGSATGTPEQVAWDRNYALREGRSFADKWREKIVRMANEMVDPGTVTTTKGIGLADIDTAADEISDSMRDAAMLQATGGDEPVRKVRSGASRGPRDERRANPLPLDALVPAWRGNMYFDNGTEIVVRRPNATEVAGFLLDRLDLPDAGMATRLESYVQQAMDALEDKVPTTARAKRAAATVFEPPAQYRKTLEQTVAGRRAPGDQRPLVNEQSFADASAYADEMRGSQTGDADWTLDSGEALPDLDASGTQAASDMGTGSAADWTPADATNPADAGSQPSGILPAVQSMFARFRKGNSGGNAPNNISSILALLGAASAAGSAQAEAGDLPPVEYLAMARNPSSRARRIAEKATKAAAQASGAATPKVAPPAAPAPAAAQAAPKPAPANLPPRRKPQPAPAPAAAQAATPAPAPAPAAVPAPTPPAPTKPPRGPIFPNDPIANAVRGIANIGSKTGVGGYLPTLLYLAASAPKVTEDAPPGLQFLGKYNPIQGFGPYLFGGGEDEGPAAMQPQGQAPDMQQLFQELDEPFPVPEPMPAPQNTSNQVEALKRMMTDIDLPRGY